MIRYGKPNADYLKVKGFFFDPEANRRLLEKAKRASAKYAQQPLRKGCVACDAPIGAPLFEYLGASYAVCPACGHLNGLNEDTVEFARFLYEQDNVDTADEFKGETQEEFMGRVRSVYLPKAEFLRDALRREGETPEALRFADLGAGAGHFVVGLMECGLTRVCGYDASQTMVDQINRRLGRTVLFHNRIDELTALAGTIEADVVTMVFSLEHIRGLNEFMAALRGNPAVRYFFFAVPMFTPSPLIDTAFPGLAPRTIGLGHTHLFSDRSLDVMCGRFAMRRVAEWWFGGNAFDIIRNVALTLRGDPRTAAAADAWMAQMLAVVDDMQLAFDRQKLSSEIHLLTKFDR